MKAKREGRIEKAEDKIWKDWYNKLGDKEHEKMLGQLGLDKEDIAEWEGHKVLEHMEQGADGDVQQAPKKPRKK